MKAIISLIVAMDKNRLIGVENRLPWHLPEDLKWFKKNTMGKPIIMGRKTYESIGRPLPGRRNIVITRNQQYAAEGCEVVYDLQQAIDVTQDVEEAVIIGGVTIYQQALDRVDRMYLTHIDAEFDGDAWFPEYSIDDWRLTHAESFAADTEDALAYTFKILERS